MTEQAIAKLDDKQAVVAVNLVVDQWLKHDGARALNDVEQVRLEAEHQKIAVPNVLVVTELDHVTSEQGDIAREVLQGFYESANANARMWCRVAIDQVTGTRTQFDPLTASLIATGLFSAMVLVSKLYSDKEGKVRLTKLNKGDVAAIAGVAAAMFAVLT
jgi:hypothetical protein